MAQIPVLKLTALFVKTIAKPVTSFMKSEASKHPTFSSLCANIGQVQHRLMSRINVLTSGYKFVGVKPLEHDVAFARGVELLAEVMVVSISGGIIMVEFWRSEKKAAIKSAQAAEKEARIEQELNERLAFLEGRLHGIEMFLDDEARAKLKAWQAEHLEADIDRILRRNHAIATASKDTTVTDRIGFIPLQNKVSVPLAQAGGVTLPLTLSVPTTQQALGQIQGLGQGQGQGPQESSQSEAAAPPTATSTAAATTTTTTNANANANARASAVLTPPTTSGPPAAAASLGVHQRVQTHLQAQQQEEEEQALAATRLSTTAAAATSTSASAPVPAPSSLSWIQWLFGGDSSSGSSTSDSSSSSGDSGR